MKTDIPSGLHSLFASFLRKPTGNAFLVPPSYGERAQAELRGAGFTLRRVPCAVGEYKMFAWRVGLGPGATRRAARLAEATRLIFGTGPEQREALTARTGPSTVLPMVVDGNPAVTFHVKMPEAGFTDAETNPAERMKDAMAAYRPLLRVLAQLTGKPVWFHSTRNAYPTLAPYPAADGVIHLASNLTPPGRYEPRTVRTVFGLEVDDGELVKVNGPTRGRGTVAVDENNVPVVQVVNDTWYLLAPTLSTYRPLVGERIFERMLAAGWDAHIGSLTPTSLPLPRHAEKEVARDWGGVTRDAAISVVEKYKRDIADYQAAIARTYMELSTFEDMLRVLDAPGERSRVGRRLSRDIETVRREPLVERVDLFRDALHVVTRPIIAQEGGIGYDLGSFVIRIDVDRNVSVWTEAPTHPEGVQHPHIPKHDGPCFGNASNAILKAAGEFRYLDAVRYVIRWLAEGYQPELACKNISEWPTRSAAEDSHAP